MAKTSKSKIEMRNGYSIELVTEDIPLAGHKDKQTMHAGSYRVMKALRIVRDRLGSLAEARKVADDQPAA